LVSLEGKELGVSLGLKLGVDEEVRVEEGSGGLVLDGPPLGGGPLGRVEALGVVTRVLEDMNLEYLASSWTCRSALVA
jgi:hypothetical protein